MNKLYIKEYRTELVEEGGIEYQYTYTDELLNSITKDNPYLHKESSQRGKSGKQYHYLYHPITGKMIGRMKMGGNNRANTSKRKDINSRNNYRN